MIFLLWELLTWALNLHQSCHSSLSNSYRFPASKDHNSHLIVIATCAYICTYNLLNPFSFACMRTCEEKSYNLLSKSLDFMSSWKAWSFTSYESSNVTIKLHFFYICIFCKSHISALVLLGKDTLSPFPGLTLVLFVINKEKNMLVDFKSSSNDPLTPPFIMIFSVLATTSILIQPDIRISNRINSLHTFKTTALLNSHCSRNLNLGSSLGSVCM